MEYQRFTCRTGKGIAVKETSFNDNRSIFNAIERLAELEDKIEQGKMIELPCKVGDTVYVIEYKGRFVGWKVGEDYCNSITFDGDKFWVNREVYDYDGFDGYVFGEYAFLTREEAENRLKETIKEKDAEIARQKAEIERLNKCVMSEVQLRKCCEDIIQDTIKQTVNGMGKEIYKRVTDNLKMWLRERYDVEVE